MGYKVFDDKMSFEEMELRETLTGTYELDDMSCEVPLLLNREGTTCLGGQNCQQRHNPWDRYA
jgi:hypothetical protein